MSRERRSVAQRMAFFGVMFASAVALVLLGWGQLSGAISSSKARPKSALVMRKAGLTASAVQATGLNPIPGITNLSQSPADETSPVWSPQGDQIAFLSTGKDLDGDGAIETVTNRKSLCTMALDGTGLTRYPLMAGGSEVPHSVLGLAWQNSTTVFVTANVPTVTSGGETPSYRIYKVVLASNTWTLIADTQPVGSSRGPLGQVEFLSLSPNGVTLYFEMKDSTGRWQICSRSTTRDVAPFYQALTRLTGSTAHPYHLNDNRHPVATPSGVGGDFVLFQTDDRNPSGPFFKIAYTKNQAGLSGELAGTLGIIFDNTTPNSNSNTDPALTMVNGHKYLIFTSNRPEGGNLRLNHSNVWYVELNASQSYPELLTPLAPKFHLRFLRIALDRTYRKAIGMTSGTTPDSMPYSQEEMAVPFLGSNYDANQVLFVSDLATSMNPSTGRDAVDNPKEGSKEIYLASVIDTQAPYITQPPMVDKKVSAPGDTLTITVPVVDTDTGVRRVWLQIKDPDNEATDIGGVTQNLPPTPTAGSLYRDGHVICRAQAGAFERTTLNYASYGSFSATAGAWMPTFEQSSATNVSLVPVDYELINAYAPEGTPPYVDFDVANPDSFPDAYSYATSDNTISTFQATYGTASKEGFGVTDPIKNINPNWLELYDDGGSANGGNADSVDTVAGDGIWTARWTTPSADYAGDWYFDVIVEDGVDFAVDANGAPLVGFRRRFDNVGGCSTLPTFDGNHNTLLVDDYADGQRAVMFGVEGNSYGTDEASFLTTPYYYQRPASGVLWANPLRNDTANAGSDLWRVMCRGPVPQEVLQGYLPPKYNYFRSALDPTTVKVAHGNQCVIWLSPSAIFRLIGPFGIPDASHPDEEFNSGSILDPQVQQRLTTQFLDQGGRLFAIGFNLPTGLTKLGSKIAATDDGVKFLAQLGAVYNATMVNPQDPFPVVGGVDQHYDNQPGLVATNNWYGRVNPEYNSNAVYHPEAAWFPGEFNNAHTPGSIPFMRHPQGWEEDKQHDHNVLTTNWLGSTRSIYWDVVTPTVTPNASGIRAFQLLDGSGGVNRHGVAMAENRAHMFLPTAMAPYNPTPDAPIVGVYRDIFGMTAPDAFGSRRALWTFGVEHLSNVYRHRPIIDTLDWMKDYTLSGKVTLLNPNGPLVNAVVTVSGPTSPTDATVVSYSTRTNTRGEYTFRGLHRGLNYTVTVTSNEIIVSLTNPASKPSGVVLRNDVSGLNFSFYHDVSAATFWGYVRQNGAPISGARVCVGTDPLTRVADFGPVLTDVNGRYTITVTAGNPLPIPYQVWADRGALSAIVSDKVQVDSILDGQSRQIDFSLAAHVQPDLKMRVQGATAYDGVDYYTPSDVIVPVEGLTKPNTPLIFECEVANKSLISERIRLNVDPEITAGWEVKYLFDVDGDDLYEERVDVNNTPGDTSDDIWNDEIDPALLLDVAGWRLPTAVAAGGTALIQIQLTPLDPLDQDLAFEQSTVTLTALVEGGTAATTDQMQCLARALRVKPDLDIAYGSADAIAGDFDGEDDYITQEAHYDKDLEVWPDKDTTNRWAHQLERLDPDPATGLASADYFFRLSNRSNFPRTFKLENLTSASTHWTLTFETGSFDVAGNWVTDTQLPDGFATGAEAWTHSFATTIDAVLADPINNDLADAQITLRMRVSSTRETPDSDPKEVLLNVKDADETNLANVNILDIVQCVTAVNSYERPDLQLRQEIDPPPFVGDDLYFTAADAAQTVTAPAFDYDTQTGVSYRVAVQNDSNTVSTYRLTIPEPLLGWNVEVFAADGVTSLGRTSFGEGNLDLEVGPLDPFENDSQEFVVMVSRLYGPMDTTDENDYPLEMTVEAPGNITDVATAVTHVNLHFPNTEVTTATLVTGDADPASFVGKTEGTGTLAYRDENGLLSDSSTPTALQADNGVTKKFIVRVLNNGDVDEQFAAHLLSVGNDLSKWTLAVTNLTTGDPIQVPFDQFGIMSFDIGTIVRSDISDLAPDYIDIEVAVTPLATATAGESCQLLLQAYPTNHVNEIDGALMTVEVEPRHQLDLFFVDNSSGLDEYKPTPQTYDAPVLDSNASVDVLVDLINRGNTGTTPLLTRVPFLPIGWQERYFVITGGVDQEITADLTGAGWQPNAALGLDAPDNTIHLKVRLTPPDMDNGDDFDIADLIASLTLQAAIVEPGRLQIEDEVTIGATVQWHRPDMWYTEDNTGRRIYAPTPQEVGQEIGYSSVTLTEPAVYDITLENVGSQDDVFTLSLCNGTSIPVNTAWNVNVTLDGTPITSELQTSGRYLGQFGTGIDIASNMTRTLRVEVYALETNTVPKLDGGESLPLTFKLEHLVGAVSFNDEFNTETTIKEVAGDDLKVDLKVSNGQSGYVDDAASLGAGPGETVAFTVKVNSSANFTDRVTLSDTIVQDIRWPWTIKYELKDSTNSWTLLDMAQQLDLFRNADQVIRVSVTADANADTGTPLTLTLRGVNISGKTDAVMMKVAVRKETSRVSVPDLRLSNATNSDGESRPYGIQTISSNGRYVAFASKATNLIGTGNDTNLKWDVFVHDRITGMTRLISRMMKTDGTLSYVANGDSGLDGVAISDDGNKVVFRSIATNLVPNDTNGQWDLFLAKTTDQWQTYSVDRVAMNATPNGIAFSRNGNYLAYIVGTKLLLKNLSTNTEITVEPTGIDLANPTIADAVSGGKIRIAYRINTATATQSTFRRIRVKEYTTTLQNPVTIATTDGTNHSSAPSISNDGTRLVFESYASDLIPTGARGDSNGTWDIFVTNLAVTPLTYQRLTERMDGAIFRQGNASSSGAVISNDGQTVAFRSYATNLVTGDTNRKWDVFMVKLVGGAWSAPARMSKTNANEPDGDAGEYGLSISGGGQYIVFRSAATNLLAAGTDTNGVADVFVRELGVEFKPNLSAKPNLATASYLGEDKYSPAPDDISTQTVLQTSTSAMQFEYLLKIHNDSTAEDAIKLTPTLLSTTAGWTVTYLTDLNNDGTIASTETFPMDATGWTTPLLPGQSGECIVKVVVTAQTQLGVAIPGTQQLQLTGVSTKSPVAEIMDQVILETRRQALGVDLKVLDSAGLVEVTTVPVGNVIKLNATPVNVTQNIQYRCFWEYVDTFAVTHRNYLTSGWVTSAPDYTYSWRVPSIGGQITVGVQARPVGSLSAPVEATKPITVTTISALSLAVATNADGKVYGASAVTLTATATASGTLEYRFTGPGLDSGWQLGTTATWTTPRTAGTYAVQVQARSTANSADARTASGSASLINPAVSAVGLTISQPAAGNPVTLTGTATTSPAGGGANEYSFRYRIKIGGVWQAYVTLATNQDSNVGVTPVLPAGDYQFIVYSREEGSTATWATQKYKQLAFTVR